MSMKLTPAALADIGTKVEQLDGLGDVEIKQITVAGHDVYLSKSGGKHVIIGISDKIKPAQTGGNIR